jgi:hypothetical protein
MTVTGGSQGYSAVGASGPAPANLGDILERVLDKGLVIAGDIRVNLLDIELLTVKLRLVVASLETAREVGIDWWERDPWLQGREDEGDRRQLEAENRRLRRRLASLESRDDAEAVESGDDIASLESGDGDSGGAQRGGRERESARRRLRRGNAEDREDKQDRRRDDDG